MHKNTKRTNNVLSDEDEKSVKFMKKLWGAFWITEALILSGSAAAVLALSIAHWVLATAAAVSGAIAAAAYWLHFHSLEYSAEDGCVIVQKGFLIRSRREIPVGSVLMIQSVELLGRTLYTSLKTAGGTAVLFCAVELSKISHKNPESGQ